MMNTTINRSASRAAWLRLCVIAALVAVGLVMGGRSPRAATGTLVPALYQTVLDANGNPVSGAKICTYLSGTSTPVATYTDVGLTVPAANPITADTAGRWSAFLTTGVSYKFVLQDATGTAGVCNGAIIRTIDTVAPVPGAANPTVNVNTADLRLTLSPGTPVVVVDVTAATTVYVTPYQGNRIALYDGTTWNLRTLTETAMVVPASTSTMYDVFAVDTLTVPTFETLAWTNDTTRATALVAQDGVLSKSGALTRRYLGSFRTTTVSGQTEDSAAKRYLWNYYHRVRRPLLRLESASTWTYTLAAWHQANANAANQVDVVVGVAEASLALTLSAGMSNTSAGVVAIAGIGEDSTAAPIAGQVQQYITNNGAAGFGQGAVMVTKFPAVGRHYYAWLEYSNASGTTTWQGVSSGLYASGLSGSIEN